MGYVRVSLDLHGLFEVIYSMLRTLFMTKNEGEDPFTKHESEPADYMNDEAFKDEDVEADREDILGDLDHDQD